MNKKPILIIGSSEALRLVYADDYTFIDKYTDRVIISACTPAKLAEVDAYLRERPYITTILCRGAWYNSMMDSPYLSENPQIRVFRIDLDLRSGLQGLKELTRLQYKHLIFVHIGHRNDPDPLNTETTEYYGGIVAHQATLKHVDEGIPLFLDLIKRYPIDAFWGDISDLDFSDYPELLKIPRIEIGIRREALRNQIREAYHYSKTLDLIRTNEQQLVNLKKVIQHAAEGIIVFDGNGRILIHNDNTLLSHIKEGPIFNTNISTCTVQKTELM